MIGSNSNQLFIVKFLNFHFLFKNFHFPLFNDDFLNFYLIINIVIFIKINLFAFHLFYFPLWEYYIKNPFCNFLIILSINSIIELKGFNFLFWINFYQVFYLSILNY